MISYADTAKMEGISRDLLTAANDLEGDFKSLYKRFSNVPNGTQEWIGGKANFYFSRIANDKKYYDKLIRELKSLSAEIAREANNIEIQVKNNNRAD